MLCRKVIKNDGYTIAQDGLIRIQRTYNIGSDDLQSGEIDGLIWVTSSS